MLFHKRVLRTKLDVYVFSQQCKKLYKNEGGIGQQGRQLLTATGKEKHIVSSGYNAVTLLWKLHKDKGNNKITELRTILQRESQNS